MHVTGEARDDDAAGRLGDDRLEHRTDVALVGREAGNVGVGRVHQKQVDAGFAESRESAQVGDAIVERQLIHLEVAGVQNDPGNGRDGDGEGIRDRVVDRDELEVKRAELLFLTLLDGERVRRDPVLFQFRFDEREREGRAENRDVCPQLQKVRHRPDVVLVAVREHDAENVIETIPDRAEVGQDQVDAGLVLFREQHAAVDDENLAVDFEGRHVATDLAQSADGRDAEGTGGELGRGLQ